MRDKTAIVGIGQSEYGRYLPDSQLRLGAKALKAALDDAGLRREDIDGIAIHLGWPLGVDYDRVAESYGLDLRWVTQTWLHGRFVTSMVQQAAMAVACGLANVVACFTAISFTRERQILGGPGDTEGTREEGGTHGESPPYGLTAPAGGAALGMQRYMHLYGATSEQLAAVPIAFRKHALKNPNAVMKQALTLEGHQASRMVVDPLHLYDCSLITDGAAVVLITSSEKARDLRNAPVYISGMQGMRSGRDEFIFAPRGLGINQQCSVNGKPDDLAYRMAGIERKDIDALYTYDAFSPLVLFTLERFGFCGPGEAAAWVQDGRIELGGALPMNTSGGLLSEAHIGGWNSILEMVRQLRGTAGERQVANAEYLQWGTAWGDSVVLRK
jgi:acetyl-CoA acetyltransferase